MENRSKFRAKIIENIELADGVFSMWIEGREAGFAAKAGQFVSLYPADKTLLLPRPISICEIVKENGRLRLVYRVVGRGTEEFSKLSKGEEVEILGPLGQGFDIESSGISTLLFGGGIGIPPLLEVAKALHKRGVVVTSVLGFRNEDSFLVDDFKKYSGVVISTDDGSLGFHGTVIDAAKELSLAEEKAVTSIYSCGPLPMLRGVKTYGEEKGILTFVSLEERMACGVGVCLGCVCETKEVDEHSHVKNTRICKDGPVFLSSEVVF